MLLIFILGKLLVEICAPDNFYLKTALKKNASKKLDLKNTFKLGKPL